MLVTPPIPQTFVGDRGEDGFDTPNMTGYKKIMQTPPQAYHKDDHLFILL
jgi:hypothetical protein